VDDVSPSLWRSSHAQVEPEVVRYPLNIGRGCRDGEAQTVDYLRSDLQFAFSSLRKARGFACAAVLTVALGVGGTSTIFAVVDSVVLKRCPTRSQGGWCGSR
jgi:hypothetical protein